MEIYINVMEVNRFCHTMSNFIKSTEQTLRDNGVPFTPKLFEFGERISLLPRMDIDTYRSLHTSPLVPLDIKINVERFCTDIQEYKHLFRRWGNDHIEYPRYGISLVNLTGSLTDEVDPACMPLIRWWRDHQDQLYWEHDFNKPTPVLDLKSLDTLNPLKQYMIRSNVLLWGKTGHFTPHVDQVPEHITHLRLWSVNVDSSKYKLVIGGRHITDYEPGRVYLIDTMLIHEATALVDDVYTLFITTTLESLSTIKALIGN